jgi:hypothetical protein
MLCLFHCHCIIKCVFCQKVCYGKMNYIAWLLKVSNKGTTLTICSSFALIMIFTTYSYHCTTDIWYQCIVARMNVCVRGSAGIELDGRIENCTGIRIEVEYYQALFRYSCPNHRKWSLIDILTVNNILYQSQWSFKLFR